MKKAVLLILAGFALFIFIFATSVMWYKVFYSSAEDGDFETLNVQLDEAGEAISESNLIPLDAVTALTLQPYEFKVQNPNDKSIIYSVLIEDSIIKDDPNYSSKSLLHRSQLEYQLHLNGTLIKKGLLSDIRNNVLDTRGVNPNNVNNYELRVYVSESAQYTEWQNKYYHFDIKIKTEVE